jgi:UDP-N-acetylmuramate: L-alanyl-gamma-D-glutamyl-meso-diaminopimelate ligase
MFSPTYENYVEQFETFGKITNGGILVYNEEDAFEVKEIAKQHY